MSNEQDIIREPQCEIEYNPKTGSSMSDFLQDRLFEFEGETNMTYTNIQYPNTAEILMKKGKPK
jgi:hypothetical protein